MKIIIEEHGGMVSVDFKGPDKNAPCSGTSHDGND